MSYQRASIEVNWKRAECEAASARYKLAQIRKRLAELEDQHEPLQSVSNGDPFLRQKMCAAAFYAVIGRWPEEGRRQA